MLEVVEARPDDGKSPESHIRLIWSLNLLCVIGACMGVVALFVEWLYNPPTIPGPVDIRWHPTIVYMVTNHYLYYGAATAFLVGTVAAFVSPLGGAFQSVGVTAFALGMIESGDDLWLDGIDPQQELRIGMCLGMVSCALVVASLFAPVGTGRLRPSRERHISLADRFLTVSVSVSR